MNGRQSKKQKRELKRMYGSAIDELAQGTAGNQIKALNKAIHTYKKEIRRYKILLAVSVCILGFILTVLVGVTL